MNKFVIEDVHKFLRNNFSAVLATCFLSIPHASTVYYLADEKLNFYFITKMNTLKYLNLKTNKNAALVIGKGPRHITVQVSGHATIIKDKKQSKKIADKLELLFKQEKIKNPPFRKIDHMQSKKKELDGELVYKIIPQHLIFTNLDDLDYPNSISEKQHTIIPILKK